MIEDLSADLQKVLQKRANLKSYNAEEEVLQYVVKNHPDHKAKEWVAIKVKLLNQFYSTGIQAINIVMDNVMKNNIDKCFAKPEYDPELVEQIALMEIPGHKPRRNYSFATKYCALHQPDKYPIYDSIVANVLTSLFKQNMLPPFRCQRTASKTPDLCMSATKFKERMNTDYDFFVKVYKSFIAAYGLTGVGYRQVDWYLWGAYKLPGDKFRIEELTQLSDKLYTEYKD